MLYSFVFIFTPMGLLSTLKSLMLVALLLLFFIKIYSKVSYKIMGLPIVILLLLLLETQHSFYNGSFEKEIFLEFKSMIGVFFSAFILVYSLTKEFINPKKYLKIIILAHMLYLLIKIILTLAYFFDVELASILISELSDSLGVNILAYGVIPKITLPNDILTPIVILIILLHQSLRNKLFRFNIDKLILMIAFISILMTFNRYNIVILGSGILLYLLIIDIKKIFHFTIGIGIFLFLFTLVDNTLINVVLELWDHRLSTEGDLSTGEKTYQYSLFWDRIQNNIFFGNGLGTFLYDYIRDDGIRYGYEAFIMLLLYQFGIIGVIFLLSYYYLFYFLNIKYLKNKYLFFNLIMSTFLFVVSFVNPMILNSMFAVAYTLVISNFILTKKLTGKRNG